MSAMDSEDNSLVMLLAVLVFVNYLPTSEASVVGTVPAFRGWTREDIRLPCHSEKAPLAVFWTKENISNQTVETMKASFFDGYSASEDERFSIDVNYNLVITDLQVADEGRYYCQLMLENFEILLNSTNLTVSFPVVDTAPAIHGWNGEDIRLPCDFQDEPLAVYWVKESMSHPELSTSKAFFDGEFVSMEERFSIDKTFSLLITDLKVADRGLYICQVVLQTFEDFSNSTLVSVSSIQECVDERQSNPIRCTYQTSSNTSSFNLACIVSGFKPNITIIWTEEPEQRLYSVVSHQTTLPDGTYERSETITVEAKSGTEQTFSCTATGDSLNGTATAEIIVLPIPGSLKR
ncbi:roundabout homolog 1-like [Diadema setosum]|uniref:roundabout homolog 1-like n=1 Tax=Diadema setosum TaxID=31175 RepID=UPI003B3B3F4B